MGVERRLIKKLRRDLALAGKRDFVPIGNASRIRLSVFFLTGAWGAVVIGIKGRQLHGMSKDFSPAKTFSTSQTNDIVLTDEDLEGLEELELVSSGAASTGDVLITITDESEA